MADEPKPVVVIPREKAVFRLDKNGKWRGGNDKFSNIKISRYFHSMIKKDRDGYFLEQEHEQYIEKVYFPYEDTALFVFRVIPRDGLILLLNTGKKIRLDPGKLFTKHDNLYVENNADIIKFNENALLSLSDYLDDVDDQFIIDIDGKRYPIAGIE